MAETSFGSLLKQFRVRRGLSQEALAEGAGVSVEAISALERGARRAPYRDTVDRLAAALGLGATDRALFHAAVNRRRRLPQTALPAPVPSSAPALPSSSEPRRWDWGEAPTLGTLHGRVGEQELLTRWLVA